jgi:flagella basal body P-ring formation protein FlgA
MRLFTAILIFCLACVPAFAGSIRLRTAAAVEPGQPIRLGDVATLEGDDALALAATTVVEDVAKESAGRAWVQLTFADVRRVLDECGARMSNLTLSGSGCTVRIAGAPKEQSEESKLRAPSPRAESVELEGPPTIRRHAARTLAAFMNVDPADLRMLFDAADAEFLDQPRTGAARIVVQPQSTANSGRAVLACRILDGDRIIDSRTIRVDSEVRRRVVVVQDMVKRKDEVPGASLAEQEMWLPATSGRPIGSIEEAAGSIARTRLEPGTVLRAEHLETPIVVKRNELVSVHAVRAGFEVQTRARARADARRGDLIAFRLEGSKKEFTARVEGPGVAVIDMDGAASPEGEE